MSHGDWMPRHGWQYRRIQVKQESCKEVIITYDWKLLVR